MKKSFLLTLIALFTLGMTYGQEENTSVGDGLIDFKKMNKASDRLVFELFFNQLSNKSDLNLGQGEDVKLGWYSRGLNAYFTYDIVLGNSPVSLAPGIGFGYNNYYNDGRLVQRNDSTFLFKMPDSIDIKKNKIATTYIEIPVEIRFRTKPNEKNGQWKFAVGARVGVLVKSHWKYKGSHFSAEARQNDDDDVQKFKEFKLDNLERLRYGVSARVGYNSVNVFGTYYFSKLFKDGQGPAVNPFSIGIAITGL